MENHTMRRIIICRLLFAGSVLGVITICLCMAGRDEDSESEIMVMDQAREIKFTVGK